MKKYILFLLIAFTLSSCCTKKYCVEISEFSIKFYGFDKADLDTIYTTGYAISSGFTQVTKNQQTDTVVKNNSDTAYTLQTRSGTPSHPMSPGSLYAEHEWVIYIPALNKTIHLSNYGYNTYNCNQCVFRKGEKKHSLSTCSVNGITQNVSEIKVYK